MNPIAKRSSVSSTGPHGCAPRSGAKRGPGLHHIGYAVDDVEEEANRLTGQGLRRVDLGPKAGAAFFYPQDVHGVLTEFVPYRQPGVRVHTSQR